MKVYTRNNVSVIGKEKILLLASKRDEDKYFQEIVNDITSLENCAIIYVSQEETFDLSTIVACVLLVSKYLLEDKEEIFSIYQNLITRRIPILPIAVESDLKSNFNREFSNNLHCVQKDNIEISKEKYNKELKNWLSKIVISENLYPDIKRAFKYHIFLSYRKNDYEKAKKIINFLRKNEKLNEAAIWFDDYLVPGEDYSLELAEQIKNCDVFILVITPKIFEENYNSKTGELQLNYVARVEYPLALKYKKPIIGLMIDPVDENILYRYFEGIHSLVRYNQKTELKKALKISGITANRDFVDNPSLKYLRGIAFLNGVITEINVNKGIKLLDQAANSGQKDALSKLGQMYYSGMLVEQNSLQSSKYYQRLILEVEKSDSIRDYPYCYTNYANTLLHNKGITRNYQEVQLIMEKGINKLRKNQYQDDDYMFYYALTLANYRNLIHCMIIDEVIPFDLISQYVKKREEVSQEAKGILQALIDKDDKLMYKKLLMAIEIDESEDAWNAGKEDSFLFKILEEKRVMYELNPLENEMELVNLLTKASVNALMHSEKTQALKWAREGLQLCHKISDNSKDQLRNQDITLSHDILSCVYDYYEMGMLGFLQKYNDYMKNSQGTGKKESRHFILEIEAEYLKKNNDISYDIIKEIEQTLSIMKTSGLYLEDHFSYVLLNLEYAYKNISNGIYINPVIYLQSCGDFFASQDQRQFLGSRMIEIAIELCKNGQAYLSALNCLICAQDIFEDLVKVNDCYLGDLKVAQYMRSTLEQTMQFLKENANYRLIVNPEMIVNSKDSGIFLVEFE